MSGLFFLVAVLAVAAPQVQVSTVDGRVTTRPLLDFSGKRVLSNSTLASFPIDQILCFEPSTPPSPPLEKPVAWIELVDGSKLTATEFTVAGDVANVSLASESSTISTRSIRTVRFSQPDALGSAAWPANVGADATGDLLAVHKKDQIDFMEGTLGSVDENHVILKVDGENYPVNRSKVDGLIYFHKAADHFSEPLCVVETANGCRIKAKELLFSASSEDSTQNLLSVTTYADYKFIIPWSIITKLDFSAGKIDYLSDLESASMQWTPYLDFGTAAPALAEYYAPRRDEGPEHQPLRLGGKTYNKGLSLYSRTAIDYRVPAGMKEFKATAGIDDSVREAGNVRLQISADGKKLFDQAVTGKDAPVELDLNVAGAKRLSILVDYGDRFDAGDYLDLADARMLK
jgi:hypothetical protein